LSAPGKADDPNASPTPVSIVLTGGPCAGKSSILALIRDRLRKRGIQVVTVPEYATHFFANSDGFQVEWVGTKKEDGLQDVFLRYQMMQESMFKDFAALNSKPSVLLFDRAVMDQKVFTSSEKIWYDALKKNDVTERDLLDRYDMVIHLTTCAKVGDYEWGPGSNNPGRYHNPDEAAELDKKCDEVYAGHKQMRVVPHFPKFQDKVDQVMKYLEDGLGVDGLAGRRQRISVRCTVESVPAEVISQSQAFVITSTFLDESLQLSVQRRLRVTVDSWLAGLKGEAPKAVDRPISSSHIDQTFEERRSIPSDNFLARRVLTEDVYHNQIRLARHESVDKHVLTFQSETSGQHYELFYFQGAAGVDVVLDFAVGGELPSWLASGAVTTEAQIEDGPARKLRRHTTAEAAEDMHRTRAEKTN